MAKLGVNIDHVATVRQARRGQEPDPAWAAVVCQLAGADGITLHLREDRRHINDRDARRIRELVQIKYNLEMASSPEMVQNALSLKPDQATLVPERRQEITTEGGLDVIGQRAAVQEAIRRLQGSGVIVSLFIDPDVAQVEASKVVGADAVELHTGAYAEAKASHEIDAEFAKLVAAGAKAHELGMTLHLGHGLNFHNVKRVCQIPHIDELNIGHSIISRAVFVGLEQAIRDMKQRIA